MTLQQSRLIAARLPKTTVSYRSAHAACAHLPGDDMMCEAECHRRSWEEKVEIENQLLGTDQRYITTALSELPQDYRNYLDHCWAEQHEYWEEHGYYEEHWDGRASELELAMRDWRPRALEGHGVRA